MSFGATEYFCRGYSAHTVVGQVRVQQCRHSGAAQQQVESMLIPRINAVPAIVQPTRNAMIVTEVLMIGSATSAVAD